MVPQSEGALRRALRTWSWADRYSTGQNDLVEEFYRPALERAHRYDRATGYFRSSFYALTRDVVASFARRGGRIRLICSPDLAEDDVAAIAAGADARERADAAFRRELERVLDNPHAATGSELLAAMYALGVIEIRLALRESGGIFHDKFGVFKDDFGDAVSFAGSVNETWKAWHPYGNHESFEVFTSWGAEAKRPLAHTAHFETLWNGTEAGVAVIQPSGKSLERLVAQTPPHPEATVEEAARRSDVITQPSKRTSRILFDHQRQALAEWRRSGRRGILEHATGSGKTVTALHAVREHVSEGNPALVVVPSVLLADQWEAEATRELKDVDPAILRAGGGHVKWRSLLGPFTVPDGQPRIVIATLATASSEPFLKRLEPGEHLMVVCDEVHTAGAAKASAIFGVASGPRLGLSATPRRAGDPAGTRRILEYFKRIIQPPFTLADAIAAGRLTPYRYYVHTVALTSDEIDEWNELTTRIRRLAAQHEHQTPLADLEPALKHLLIKRARLAKNAAAKTDVAVETVAREYESGHRWLIYCDNTRQVETICGLLKEASVPASPYYADMPGDKAATLDRFVRDGGALVAVRCLDEGVDIPSVTHACIIASSRNPREFVQRRGRVLRRHPEKRSAVVHDLFVLPPKGDDVSSFESLVLSELARAYEFAGHAVNPAVELQVRRIALEYGIDVDGRAAQDYDDLGYEEEEEEEPIG